jgi:hypothetical protein
MERPNHRWRRFGLATLLLVIAIFAVGLATYRWLPNYLTRAEVLRLGPGMGIDEVHRMLGDPHEVIRRDGLSEEDLPVHYEVWIYAGVAVEFKDRKLTGVADSRFLK